MKTLFVVVLTAAVVAGGFLSTDITRHVEQGMNARRAFATLSNRDDGDKEHIKFTAAGVFANTLEADGVSADPVEISEMVDQTVNGTDDALDINYRMYLLQLGFKRVCINGVCKDLPQHEDPRPPHGSREYVRAING